MKLWLSKSTEVPLQEQLITQIVLGIVSGDLAPKERLPSSSQLARRFKIHANTVRAAYRGLTGEGWIEWRKGSGFYVRDRGAEGRPGAIAGLDHLIASFLTAARRGGYSVSEIQVRLRDHLARQYEERILVIESDPNLREILVAEIQDQLSVPVDSMSPQDCSDSGIPSGVLCVALYDHARSVRAMLPPEESCVFLRSNSVPKSISTERRPPADTLISVVSRWPDFLRWARATLTGVGIDPDLIELRDGQVEGWGDGLAKRGLIVTDSVMGRMLPTSPRLRVFRVIASESLEELRQRFDGKSRSDCGFPQRGPASGK